MSSSGAGIGGTLKIHPVLYSRGRVSTSGAGIDMSVARGMLKIHPVLDSSEHVSSSGAGIGGTLKIHPVLYSSGHVSTSGAGIDIVSVARGL